MTLPPHAKPPRTGPTGRPSSRSRVGLALCASALAGSLGTTCVLDLFVAEHTRTPLTSWQPRGERLASETELENALLPAPDRFVTIHGGLRNADEVQIAYAPVFAAAFTTATAAFVPEGPTFDADGNLYFTPTLATPGSDVARLLVALDGRTGERLFDVGPGQRGQGGAPLLLRDPDTGEEIVYTGGFQQVLAVDRAGNVLWRTDTELVSASPRGLHLYGLQYHPASDTILSVYGTGDVVAFDRRTGARLGQFRSPGAPSKPSNGGLPPALSDAFNAALSEAFDLPPLPGVDVADLLLGALLGGSNIIANYFAVDPDSQRIWLASTLPDEADGSVDGEAELGALYGIDLVRNGDLVTFEVHCATPFEGGSAATPAVLPGGARIYTADSSRNVVAIDRDCHTRWTADVGRQVVGSLGISSVGGEIYAATGSDLLKLRDLGDRAEIVWRADLAGAYRERALRAALGPLVAFLEQEIAEQTGDPLDLALGAANLDLAGVGENGIMVQTGFGIDAGEAGGLSAFLPLVMTMTLLDRETGRAVQSTRAVEETVAVVSTGPDGATAIANTPVRRLFLRGLVLPLLDDPNLEPAMRTLLDTFVPPGTGGITKYGAPRGHDLLARDASCGAARRLRNALDYAPTAATDTGVRADARDALRLARQAREAIDRAEGAGEVSQRRAAAFREKLERAEAALAGGDLPGATRQLGRACLLGATHRGLRSR